MRNRRLDNRAQLVLIIMMILLVAMMVGVLYTTSYVAYAEETSEPPTTLAGYLANGYREEMSFDSTELLISISGDDYIVEYIPKDCFKQEGQHMYIGDDYGYYIYTFPDGYFHTPSGSFTSHGNMRSIVLGFEIKYEQVGDVDGARDGFSYRIQPVFQREYATLMPNGSNEVGIGDYTQWNELSKTTIGFRQDVFTYTMDCVLSDGASKSDGIVVPVPHYEFGDGIFLFEDVSVFYLTDLIVSANIKNAQDLNDGDTGYSLTDDSGCFLIGTGFNLSAKEYISEDNDLAGLGIYSGTAVLKKLVSAVLGFIPGGEAISGAMDVIDYLVGTQDYFGRDYFEEVQDSSYYGTVDIPNTKYAQMQQNGHIYRSASIRTQDGSGSDVWFGNGNFFRAVFEIGSGAPNEPSWWTVAEHSVSARVTSLFYDLESISESSSFYSDLCNDERYKPLAEGVSSEAYVMAPNGAIKGKDYFAFVPDTTGFYTFTLTNGSGVTHSVTHDGTVCTATDLGYCMEEGEEYIITLTNGTTSLKRPTVKMSMTEVEADFGDEYTFDLPASGIAALKVDFINPFTNVELSGNNMKIYGVTSAGFMPEQAAYTSGFDQVGAEVNYLWIANTSGQEQSATVAFSDIPVSTLGEDGSYAFENISEDYYTVIQFNVDDSYNYCLELSVSTAEAVPDFAIYNEDGVPNTANRHAAADNEEFAYLLNVGNGKIYVALRSSNTYSLNLSPAGEAGRWYINGRSASTYSYDDYGGVVLEQFKDKNATYEIRYRTNSGIEFNQLNYMGDNAGISFNSSTGVLTIASNSTYIRQSIYFVYGNNVENPLKLTFTVRRGPDFEFEYTRVPLTLRLHYDASSPLRNVTVTADDHVYTFGEDDLSKTNGVIDLSAKIKADYYDAGVFFATYKVTSYKMQYGETATFTKHPGGNLSSAFNLPTYSTGVIPFAGGSGFLWDPYLITTREELEYIGEHDKQLVSYTLGNDIDLAGKNWKPWETFSGLFVNSGHVIKNMNIYISDTSTETKRYGFVGHNIGALSLNFTNATISSSALHYQGWSDVGIVAGYNEGTITGCDVNGVLTIHRNNSNIGGIVGENKGSVTSSTLGKQHFSRVMGNGDLGGIVGKNSGTVDNCQVMNSEIEFWEAYQGRSVGGIVGYNPTGTIQDCWIGSSTIIFSGRDDGENAWLPNMGYIAGSMEGDSKLIRVGKNDDVTYDLSAVIPHQLVSYLNNMFKGYWGETGYRADTVYVE